MSQLTIKRGSGMDVTTVATVTLDEATIYQQELMGMEKVTVDVIADHIELRVRDYITHQDQNYYITEAPEVRRINAAKFHYRMEFYSDTYALYNKMMVDEGATDFSYSGTPLEHISLLLDNIQSLDPTWAAGTIDPVSEVLTLSYKEVSCRKALTDIAEAFGLEYQVVDKEISLVSEVGSVQELTFQYGRGNGLYEVTRKPLDSSFATRWYGFGGTRNLPYSYREGKRRLTFDDSPVDANVDLHGVKEGSVTFDEIFPRFEGAVESTADEFTITCSDIDFDLNDQYILEGAAKIVFKTGVLGGNEFTITNYNHATKTVKFGYIQEDSGYVLPNETVRAEVDDKFTFVDIEMPESYITAAETELETKVAEHVAANSDPKVAYDLMIDEKFIRSNDLEYALKAGDRVRVVDTHMGVDADLRVQSVEYPLVNPAKVTAVISEETIYTQFEKIANDIGEVEADTDVAQEVALYARQVADEIRQYAVLNQFEKTLVGERAVMSGAFVAGNPESGDVAGINGTGTDADSIRFFAGSSYDDRATAPFRVQQDGKAFANGLTLAEGSAINLFKILADGMGILIDPEDEDSFFQSVIKSSGLGYWCDGLNLVEDDFYQNSGAVSLVNIKAAIQGLIEAGASVDSSNVKAGVAGMIEEQMINLKTYEQLYTAINGGKYGGLFSSIKNLGAKFEAMRDSRSDAALEAISSNDYHVILVDNCTGAVLPLRPDHGCTVEVTNDTSSTKAVTVNSPSTEKIKELESGDLETSLDVTADDSIKLRYHGGRRWWYQLHPMG